MGLGTAAMAVFTVGQVVLAAAVFRAKRANLPDTTAGRRVARRLTRQGASVWVVCAGAALVLMVLGDPQLLALGIVLGVMGFVLLGVAAVGDRRLERELDERERREGSA